MMIDVAKLDTTLSIIAQTGERFRDFAPYVASINDEGIVAFQAALTSGGSGVFMGDGVNITRIVETGDFGIAEVISHPDINVAGTVCFYAQMKDGRQCVMLIRRGERRWHGGRAARADPKRNRHRGLSRNLADRIACSAPQCATLR